MMQKSDTFNPECPNCKITIGRIEKWIDHVCCTPKKFQRYDKLLEFVKMISNECIVAGGDLQNKETLHWISTSAHNLLKELGENG